MEKKNKVIDETNFGFIIQNDFLNGYAKYVGWQGQVAYMALKRHAGTKDRCFPSLKQLAIELGVSVRSVQRGIRALKEWNIIKVDRQGKRDTNIYHLLPKTEWKVISEMVFTWSNTSKKRRRKGGVIGLLGVSGDWTIRRV